MIININQLDALGSTGLPPLTSSPHEHVPFLRSTDEVSILEVEKDIYRDRWHIYEWRPTNFGFPVKLGLPAQLQKNNGRAGSKVVLTSDVVDYLTQVEKQQKRNMLPLTSSAIKRLRRLLDLDFDPQSLDWYHTHIVDLANLTTDQFASKHKLDPKAVCKARSHIHGSAECTPNWWTSPDNSTTLSSNFPLTHKADLLNLSVKATRKLTALAQS